MADPFQSVDVNVASKEQLMALPGVGEKLAERILLFRQKSGRFNSKSDLLKVDGFREHLFVSLDGKILFDRSSNKVTAIIVAPIKIDISNILHEFDGEPSIRDVQEHAVNYARTNPEQVDSWLTRVRKAAWVPRFSTSGGRQTDLGQSIREKIGDTDILYRRNSADWNFKVSADWELRDLVFNRDELHIARESERQARLREHIVSTVTRTYFERRRMQIEVKLTPAADVGSEMKRQLAIAELTAELDGFTGAWFSHAN